MLDSHPFRKLVLLFTVILLATLTAGQSWAQSRKTATRTDEIDVFGMFTGVDNNYSPPLGNFGGTAGFDYTHFITQFHGLLTPSFQVRATDTPGGSVDLKSIEGGLKVASTFHGLHPYGDILIGNGVVRIPNPLPTDQNHTLRDSSFLYVFGAGLTYDLRIPNFSLIADYQHQYYDLGKTGNSPPVRFYPKAYSLGIVYRIPFKAFKTR